MQKPIATPTLTIKLKPQYQDYVRYVMMIEGFANHSSMLLAYRRSYLGRLVYPFLSKMPDDCNPFATSQPNHVFTFCLPFYDDFEVRNNTAWISPENQKHIESIVESHFRLHFISYATDKARYMRDHRSKKGSIQKVIISFCHDVNIHYDTVTYDMIKKAFYRARKKMYKNEIIFTSKRELIGHLFFLI